MTQWPATLPQSPLLQGYGEEVEDGRQVTPMDGGPMKVRPRFTSTSTFLSEMYWLTEAQYNILLDFYRNGTKLGSEVFTKPHGRTGVVRNQRFDPNVGNPVALQQVSYDKYLVEVSLEVLP